VDAGTLILLVEDDPAHAELAQIALSGSAHALQLTAVESLTAARHWLLGHSPDVVLADLRLPDGNALELLDDGVPLVVMTSQGNEQRAVSALKGGALDYVVKSPEMYRELPLIVERALRAARAERERERAELSLRESQERFRQLADSMEDVFWLYDLHEARMIYVSPAWARIYDQAPERVLADSEARFDMIHPEDRERVREALTQRAPGQRLEHEYRVLRADGVRWIEERTFPVDAADGQTRRLAGLASDVTRRRDLEAALRQSQKMEAIGQLAGGVAHDFNNMLTVIMSSAEQLRALVGQAEGRELCDLTLTAAERAAELTRRLLSFSRRGKLRSEPIDMRAMIRDAALLVERSIDRRVRVTTQLGSEPVVVVGDASELESALLNLAINARDAMPQGGDLTIVLGTAQLDATDCAAIPFALVPGSYVQIIVQDTGTGIAPENLTRVFEPFFTTKPVGQGTGLGLAAVYGAAVEHAGAVVVKSEVGKGTTFHLYLPISETAPALLAKRSQSAPRGSGLILIVDDEPLVRAAGTHLLRSLGYDVVAAGDGVEGVRMFTEHHAELAAVICDQVMPELSGSDAAAEMLRIDPQVPVILCSGFPRGVSVASAVSGVFVGKPFQRAELAGVLARVARTTSKPHVTR
jgi:two-component system cell cycle sensor histidine kinase/response regulator CckA